MATFVALQLQSLQQLSIPLAWRSSMKMELSVLRSGSCEPLKTGVHATALGLFALMGLYNAAAWLARREQHLAVNAILYAALTAWERKHVARHLAAMRQCQQSDQAGYEVAPVAPEAPAKAPAPVTILAA